MSLLKKHEKIIISKVGKVLQAVTLIGICFLLMLDPIRGRLYEWDWLQVLSILISCIALTFFVWLDNFLNAILEILDLVDRK